MRHVRGLALTISVGALLGVTACTTPSGNFQQQTEDYLNEAQEVSDQFGGVDVTDAACERPDGTAIGTNYVCTANVPGEGTVSFRIQITAEDEFSIIGFGS